jgi:hypothetical protein
MGAMLVAPIVNTPPIAIMMTTTKAFVFNPLLRIAAIRSWGVAMGLRNFRGRSRNTYFLEAMIPEAMIVCVFTIIHSRLRVESFWNAK